MTTPPAPDPAAAPLEQRVGKLEDGQETLSGKLDQILSRLPGSGPAPEPAVTHGDPAPAADPAAMAEQMRQAVRDVNAEAAAASAPRAPEPETVPREVMIKGKAKLQKALFGSEPGARR